MTLQTIIKLKDGKTINGTIEPIIEGVFLKLLQENGYDLVPASQIMTVKVVQEDRESKKTLKKVPESEPEEPEVEEEW